MSGPHDAPDAGELVASVREFLERDVLAATDGRVRYHCRVAINVLAMVERELSMGAVHARAHEERLAELGFAGDEELAAAIRAGRLDDRHAEVGAALAEAVRDKLVVANPAYLEDTGREDTGCEDIGDGPRGVVGPDIAGR